MIVVTLHATQRYVERIDPSLTLDGARAVLQSHHLACERAAAFGCHAVLTGAGAKLVLQTRHDGDCAIVTVKNARFRTRPVPGSFHKRFRKARGAVA